MAKLTDYLVYTPEAFYKATRSALLRAIGRLSPTQVGSGTPDPGDVLYGDGTWGPPTGGGGSANVTKTLTIASTIIWDYSLGIIVTVTIAGNRTLSVTNVSAGTFGVLKVKQDAVGGRTLTLPGYKKSGFSFSTGA